MVRHHQAKETATSGLYNNNARQSTQHPCHKKSKQKLPIGTIQIPSSIRPKLIKHLVKITCKVCTFKGCIGIVVIFIFSVLHALERVLSFAYFAENYRVGIVWTCTNIRTDFGANVTAKEWIGSFFNTQHTRNGWLSTLAHFFDFCNSCHQFGITWFNASGKFGVRCCILVGTI